MRMYQVDAFTERLFAGNPAAVLVLDDWLPDDCMLAITQENNLAETAFVKARSDGAWDLRWFAPVHEVDFCGHATLATAHVLLTEIGAQAPLTFHTRVGELRVSKNRCGYRLDIPRLPPVALEALPTEIATIFAHPPVRIFRNFENIFVDLGSADAVRNFVPDLAAIARLGSVGLVVTAQEGNGGKAHFVSRYFVPGAGIPEDPVTGSIHATLVPYWAEHLGRKRLMAFQASARGGWLDCELTEDRVLLVGNAVTFMQATIYLPETVA
ncbi:PhzF family phenazine biosynthesis protein [Gluconacetobacter azotocaptans]|uniref:PhzF family phenazine biosynthesis protein n=1 Tax=Gluconacetobacter azotocaptans TaxID=142834 RepID=A0A7W4JTY6_9PROT|nr:PhzF family phenazine biosynthesis protein [Gluconacetobacter azotocaptans]MBB2190847.1 PhzF family phenazine biosynthesis protein [Gluconacetobacter azotocaptans]GBQ31463.1 phenazine biosynthesis PhzC/PhzF protein [Gluconacetobacter azotocaptans DSM 13594]